MFLFARICSVIGRTPLLQKPDALVDDVEAEVCQQADKHPVTARDSSADVPQAPFVVVVAKGVTVTVQNLTFETVDKRCKCPTSSGDEFTQSKGNATPSKMHGGEISILGHFVDAKKPRAVLLRDVTAAFLTGCMTAIMGPSGCGKSVLLDLMSGRKTTGHASSGTVMYAGQPATAPFLRRYTGYVEQIDTLIPLLTPREMLMYTAEIKQPRSITRDAKHAVVESVLDKLGLRGCADVRIGSALDKGISGGQMKRTNIGIALVTSPRVLFLDEPTSGLDSATANEVTSILRRLAAHDNTTIIMSVHTPTAYAFSMFDDLLLLSRGRTVYFGAAHLASAYAIGSLLPVVGVAMPELVSALTVGNEVIKLQSINQAEVLLDLLTSTDRLGGTSALADAWAACDKSTSACARVARAEVESHANLSDIVLDELNTRRETATPWWWAMLQMARFRTRRNYVDATFVGPRVLDKLVLAIVIVTLFLGTGRIWRPDNYLNMAAVLFILIVIAVFCASTYVPALYLERGLLQRERADGLYTVTTYFAFRMLEEMVISALGSFLSCLIVFFGVGLSGSLLLLFATQLALVTVGVLLSFFVATLAPSMDVASCTLPAVGSTLVLFAGFMIPLAAIPKWWAWFTDCNPLRYAFTAELVNQFGDRDPQFIGKRTVLQYFNADGKNAWSNMGFVWIFAAGLSVMTWCALHRNFVKR